MLKILHSLTPSHTHTCIHTLLCTFSEKLIFFDVIIEDDEGETEPPEEVVPYQLSKEAMVLDMKVQDIRVMLGKRKASMYMSYTCRCMYLSLILSTYSSHVYALTRAHTCTFCERVRHVNLGGAEGRKVQEHG
jgi:hypothetical protein